MSGRLVYPNYSNKTKVIYGIQLRKTVSPMDFINLQQNENMCTLPKLVSVTNFCSLFGLLIITWREH